MIETTPLYGGDIIVEFNPGRHTYTVINKGKRFKVPSVTRITSVLDKSGPLVNWAIKNTLEVCRGAIAPGVEYAEAYLDAVWTAAKRESDSRKSDAADKGKAFHREMEQRCQHAYRAQELVELEGMPKFQPLAVERRVYSRRHRFSGTCDLIAESDQQTILVDWKTGKNLYAEHLLQTAAYVAAYEEEFPDIKIAGRYLVRILEDGTPEPHFFPASTFRRHFQGFLGAKTLFEQSQKIEAELRKLLKTKAK